MTFNINFVIRYIAVNLSCILYSKVWIYYDRILSFFDQKTELIIFSDKVLDSITSGGFSEKDRGGHSKQSTRGSYRLHNISNWRVWVIVIILILVLFIFFLFLIIKKVNYEKDDKIKLILVGSISLILMQTMIHIGVNIRLFPTTGMTLPYLSYGGSSIIGVSILSGIILNLTKRNINRWKKY